MKNASMFFQDDGSLNILEFSLTILGFIAFLVTVAFFSAVAMMFCGCSSMGDGAKVVEGTDLTLGVQFPYADCDTMAVMNYLTGFRVTVAENARARVKYTCAETNDYLGIVTTRVYKNIDATVTPTMDTDDTAQDDEDTSDNSEK